MRRAIGLVGVAGALLLGTGCFEVKLAIALQPDGAVAVTEGMWLTPGVVDLLWEVGHQDKAASARFAASHDLLMSRFGAPSADTLATLHQAGVRSLDRKVAADRKAWGMEQAAVYDSIDALSAGWDQVHGEAGLPAQRLNLKVSCDPDRVCTLNFEQVEGGMEQASTPFDGLADALKPDEAEPDRKPRKRDAKDAMDRLAHMMEVLSAEAANLKIGATLTLPGEVLEPLPPGATVDGRTLSWGVDGSALVAAAMGGAAAEPPEPKLLPAGLVRFRLDEGVAVPAGWVGGL